MGARIYRIPAWGLTRGAAVFIGFRTVQPVVVARSLVDSGRAYRANVLYTCSATRAPIREAPTTPDGGTSPTTTGTAQPAFSLQHPAYNLVIC